MNYLSVRVLRLDHVFTAKWNQIQSKTNRRASRGRAHIDDHKFITNNNGIIQMKENYGFLQVRLK